MPRFNWRRLPRWIALIVFLLLAGFVMLIHLDPVQQFVLRRVEQMARVSGYPFKAQHLRFKPFALEATLRGFVYDDRGTHVEADELRVDFPWRVVSADGIVVNGLWANKVRIAIQRSEPTRETERIPRFVVKRLNIQNAALSYVDASTRIDVPEFDIEAEGGPGVLKFRQPVTVSRDTTIQLDSIPINLSPDRVSFGPVSWSAQHGKYSGDGSSRGVVRWTPTIAAVVSFQTRPLDIEKWDDVEARGLVRYEDNVLHVDDFRAKRGEGILTASANIAQQDNAATLMWDDISIAPLDVRGESSGELHLQWSDFDLKAITGQGRVRLVTAEYGTADTDVDIRGGRANLRVHALSQGADIRGSVSTGLDRRLSGTFEATHRQYGLVTASGQITGSLNDPRVDADLRAADVKYKDVGPVTGTARASYRDRTMDITGIMAALRNSSIPDGRLHVDLKSRMIDGAVPEINLQAQDFVPDATGTFQASTTISGSLDHPMAAFTASSMGIDVGETHIDSVQADATLDGSIIQVSRLLAKQAEGSLEGAGIINLETEQTEGQVKVANLQITNIRDLSTTVNLDAEISGSYRDPSANIKGELSDLVYDSQAHGTVLLSGTVDQRNLNLRLESAKYNAAVDSVVNVQSPYAFTATVQARKSSITYQTYSAVADGRLDARGAFQPARLDSIAFDHFTLDGEGVNLRADGSLEAGMNVNASAKLAELPIEDVELTGDAEIAAVVHGPADNLTVEGDLRTTNATVRTEGMTGPASIEAVVDFMRDRFAIRSMRAEYEDSRISIDGAGKFTGSGEFNFVAENIRPERFLPNRPITGIAGLQGQMRIDAPRLDAVSGTATVTQLDLSVRGVQIRQSEPGEIRIENQIATLRNFNLTGPETQASATGTVNLRTGDLALDLEANTNLRLIEGFISDSSAAGRIESEITLRGNTSEPNLRGFINLQEAQLQILDPPILLADVNSRLALSGDRVEIQQATGEFNGGTFQMSGSTGLSSSGLDAVRVQIQLTNATLEYPEGLQSGVTAKLSLEGSSPSLLLSGNVDVLDGIYRKDVEDLKDRVLEQLALENEEAPAAFSIPAFAGDLNLDVTVNTTGPVTVSNNLAKADLYGTFRIRGKGREPIILGRADAAEGGEVYFGPMGGGEAIALRERRDRFSIERGIIEFNNTLRTEPVLDFEATHDLQVQDERYAIRLRATGPLDNLRTELTSDPFLSEPDIIAMLLTGRSFSELQGAQVAVAREQLLDYVSGQLSSRFFRGAGTAIGLDTVTVEPVTAAAEEDVSARLTVGKNISSDVSVIYGQNLSGPRNQSWIVNYSTFKNLVVRAINRPDEDELRFELRHGLEIGGGPPLPQRVTPREDAILAAVTFSETKVPVEELMKRVEKVGKPYSLSVMSDDVRSLQQFLASNGYADAKIRASRGATDGRVNVHFTIEEGPRISFEYRGAAVPDSVQQEVRQVWVDTRTEEPAMREAVDLLRGHFLDKGYLDGRVSVMNESSPDERHYLFDIELGQKYDHPKWVFQGIEPVDITDKASEVLQDPDGIRKQIELRLRAQGFLDAKSTVPVLEKLPMPRFIVSVDPGLQYAVTALKFEGNTFVKDSQLTTAVLTGPTPVIPADEPGAARPPDADKPLKPFPYTSDWVNTARRRIMTEYWQQGFNDVLITPSTRFVPGSGQIEVGFDIKEGERQMIADVRILGDEKTLRDHLQRYFQFSPGDPVDYSRISLTRKRLYDTGLFKRVDIQIVDEGQGRVAEVRLNERAPWSLKYGGTISEHREEGRHDRDLGLSTEVIYRNLLGRGVTIGLSNKLDTRLREARLFSSFPVFFDRDVTSTVTLFRSRESLPDILSNTWGLTLKQQWRLRDFYLLSYDYSYRRVSSFETDKTEDDPDVLDGVVRVGRFNATLTRDTRDDVFNATRGTFLSNSFDFAPPGVFSDIRYVRNYTQYLRFNEIRPNLIWASAYRFGIAHGFGGSNLVPTDQFRAGGATSLRAFSEDNASLSPGNALFITNQELRYPLFSRVGVVGFFDVGNVYERIGTANLLRQRYSPGFGIRINTPFVLLRVDMGLNLWSRTGEDGRRISFGIGHAF
jgi:outer membrane protein assembly factor BamA/autotransporter translocation and assembly factor TamB